MTDEPNCLACETRCELHGDKECPSCHKHVGECNFGACEAEGTIKVEHFRDNGVVVEIRNICADDLNLVLQRGNYRVMA